MAKTTTTTTKAKSTNGGSSTTVTGAIQHIELPSTDAPKLKKFLEKTFGWKFETMKMPGLEYHSFRTPAQTGGGVFTAQPGQPIQAVPYVNVENIEATLKTCEKNGATILMPITEVPGQGRFFQFQVPGGPILACWEQTK